MTDFFFLVPIALLLGIVGLCAFMWTLKSGQYEDLDGAAHRILFDNDDHPARPRPAMARLPSQAGAGDAGGPVRT
jgi:cbb3-type cytochrome oxidase maturation protein